MSSIVRDKGEDYLPVRRCFDGTGYRHWVLRMRYSLQKLGLLHLIDRTTKDGIESAIIEDQEKDLLRYISNNILDKPMSYIQNCATGTEAWKALAKVYEPKDRVHIRALRQEFHRYEMKEGMSIKDHIETVSSLANQLNNTIFKYPHRAIATQ